MPVLKQSFHSYDCKALSPSSFSVFSPDKQQEEGEKKKDQKAKGMIPFKLSFLKSFSEHPT